MARPRSLEAHEKVVRAALDLFGERGIDATSMDAISRASGVSKATIYNHWADKEALLLEVMLFATGLDREPEDVDTGDIERDLATVLTRRPPDEFEQARDRITPFLIAYSAVHPEFGKEWRHRVMERPRQCLKQVLRRGIERGQLASSLDLDRSMALLLGPGLYTHIFDRGNVRKSEEVGAEAALMFWRAYAARPNVESKAASGIHVVRAKKDRRTASPVAGSLDRLVAQLENDAALTAPEQLGRRLEALDVLDLCGAALEQRGPHGFFIDVALARRARIIRAELEQANSTLYRSVREQIRRGAAPETIRRRLLDLGAGGAASDEGGAAAGKGYDALEDLIAGVLEFAEPAHPRAPGPEMIAYQPTPARHIFSLLRIAELARNDVFVDLGSGLGHVPLIASICTPAQCVGIEIEQSYVDSAKQTARNLNLKRVKFIRQDAREADLSKGTVMFLYTPFIGSVLRDVLNKIRNEAARRPIRLCTFGPCTPMVAAEPWLKPASAAETDRVVLFRACA
jgi:AcrR family transcriptional regulator/SAM-dependent methyltransferase